MLNIEVFTILFLQLRYKDDLARTMQIAQSHSMSYSKGKLICLLLEKVSQHHWHMIDYYVPTLQV